MHTYDLLRFLIRCSAGLKSQVGLGLTPNNAGFLLGAGVRRRVAFETINYRDEVSERNVTVNVTGQDRGPPAGSGRNHSSTQFARLT